MKGRSLAARGEMAALRLHLPAGGRRGRAEARPASRPDRGLPRRVRAAGPSGGDHFGDGGCKSCLGAFVVKKGSEGGEKWWLWSVAGHSAPQPESRVFINSVSAGGSMRFARR